MIRLALACACALTVMSACADTESVTPLALALASSASADASAPTAPEEALQPLTYSNDINGVYIHPACSPVYPAVMAAAGVEARCDVRFRIDAEGEPIDASANCELFGLTAASDDAQASQARESFASAAIAMIADRCNRYQPDFSGRLYSRSIEFRLE